MNNSLRKALLDRTPAFGAWVQIGHPATAEDFARLGFDWICVDLEHGGEGKHQGGDFGRLLDDRARPGQRLAGRGRPRRAESGEIAIFSEVMF